MRRGLKWFTLHFCYVEKNIMKKNIEELQNDLARLKVRENSIKEEMELLRKSADMKEQRKRKGKMFTLAEVVMDCLGEEILDQPKELELFLQENKKDWFLKWGVRDEVS